MILIKKDKRGTQYIYSFWPWCQKLINQISNRLKNNQLNGPMFSRERHIENLKKSLDYHNLVNFNEIDKAAEDIRGHLIVF